MSRPTTSPAQQRDPQLLKGVLPMLVLALLTARESYGYELVTRLQEVGLTDITTGTVYPVLTRLEREGQVSSRLVASPSGPARKYYRPTPDGTAALDAAVHGWERLGRTVANALSVARPDATDPDVVLTDAAPIDANHSDATDPDVVLTDAAPIDANHSDVTHSDARPADTTPPHDPSQREPR